MAKRTKWTEQLFFAAGCSSPPVERGLTRRSPWPTAAPASRSGIEPLAQIFAENGFVVLLHDHRSFGASDGEPRQDLDCHYRKLHSSVFNPM
jgi:hypothetical protein